MDGVVCLELHPELYHRDCQHCLKYFYDEKDGGKLKKDKRGQPLERPRGTCAPCRKENIGCPKGTPEDPSVLTPENVKALRNYRACKMKGQWPDDDIIVERAIFLDQLFAKIQEIRQDKRDYENLSAMISVIFAGKV